MRPLTCIDRTRTWTCAVGLAACKWHLFAHAIIFACRRMWRAERAVIESRALLNRSRKFRWAVLNVPLRHVPVRRKFACSTQHALLVVLAATLAVMHCVVSAALGVLWHACLLRPCCRCPGIRHCHRSHHWRRLVHRIARPRHRLIYRARPFFPLHLARRILLPRRRFPARSREARRWCTRARCDVRSFASMGRCAC